MQHKKSFKYIGRAVQQIRLFNKMTQREFGEKIGVHGQYVSNCERALCSLPDYALKRIGDSPRTFKRLRQAMIQDALEDTQRQIDLIFGNRKKKK